MTNRYLDIVDRHLVGAGAAGSFAMSVLQVLRRIPRLGHALAPFVLMSEFRPHHAATLRLMVAMPDRLKAALWRTGAPREHAEGRAGLREGLAAAGGERSSEERRGGN